jgi:UDP-2,3-diacylglucosamine pyrophosphatase LpxH
LVGKTGLSDNEFIQLWNEFGSATKLAKHLDLNVRGVFQRRRNIEKKKELHLKADTLWGGQVKKINYRQIVENVVGPVVIFSDMHAWPGDRSPAFFALLEVIKKIKPKLIINNGDAFDGATISRHPPAGYLDLPSVEQELSYCQELLKQVENAAPKGTPLLWCAGNHDNRFTARLAQMAPEFAKIKGVDLRDHFPKWTWGWSACLNPGTRGETWVKHRWHNGQHASFNNVLKSGVNIVTGHTHQLKATPFTDYKGRRWGVECGSLSPVGLEAGHKFSYAEDSPSNSCQGFVVLHYTDDGKLLPPELVETIDGSVYWRGAKIF